MHQGIIFLVLLGFFWMIFASIQDIKKREVANWLNFSLIIFAVGIRFFYSFFLDEGFIFFYQGLIGLIIFFLIGNLFYYLRIFAGGDAKLMIALGAILPFSNNFITNVKIYILFLSIFFIVGSIYGIFYSIVLMLKNFKSFKKEFSKQFKLNKKLFYVSFILFIIIFLLSFLEHTFFYFSIILVLFPFLYIYSKAVEEGGMIFNVKTLELTEGDWLYSDVKVGKRIIKAKWDGVDKREITFLKKHLKFVRIKKGIPFIPVFLISFIVLLLIFLYFPLENYGVLLGNHIFSLDFSIFSAT